MAAQAALEAFEAWMRHNGVTTAPAIRLVAASGRMSGLALAVEAARDIVQGDHLCTIPKAACISVRTTGLADVIEAEQLGGGLGLVLAVLYEMAQGERSKWHGYLASLPPREYVPALWSEAELALLAGTELQARVPADRVAMAEDWVESVAPLLDKYPRQLSPREAFSLERFGVAASYVASRAFGVDDYHGDAMVPVADIFNHKCSVVELNDSYRIHGADSDSEGEHGSDSEGKGEGDEGSSGCEGEVEEAAGAAEVEEALLCDSDCSHDQKLHAAKAVHRVESLPAVMAAGSNASRLGLVSANGLHLRLEIAIVDRGDALEIVAASDVPFGELGNAELVSKYGFALRQNPFTVVSLDKSALLAGAEARLGQRAARGRARFLRAHTRVLAVDADGDEEEPLEALPNAHVSPPLFVALRVLGASNEEASSWRSVADALALPGSDSSGRMPQVPPVQLWPMLAADGKRRSKTGAAAAEPEQQRGRPGLEQLLSASACELLIDVIGQRLCSYPTSLSTSWKALSAALSAARSGPLSDQQSAALAALMLRATEQEILSILADAARQRLELLRCGNAEAGIESGAAAVVAGSSRRCSTKRKAGP